MEHQFKVGDWVTVNNGKPHQFYRFTKDLPEWNKNLNYENIEMIDKSKYHIPNFDRSIVRFWQPKVNEYCWFWNQDGGIPVFGKFKSINSNFNKNKYISSESWYEFDIPANANIFYDQWRRDWKFCEPFLGQQPSFLKGN